MQPRVISEILLRLHAIRQDLLDLGWPDYRENPAVNMERATEFARRRNELMQEYDTTWEEFKKEIEL